MTKPVLQHNIVDFKGEKMIEVEWPADGRYWIHEQVALPVQRPGRASYMGLFEYADKHLRVTAK